MQYFFSSLFLNMLYLIVVSQLLPSFSLLVFSVYFLNLDLGMSVFGKIVSMVSVGEGWWMKYYV